MILIEMFKKPIKITIDNPCTDIMMDYEMIGKIIDNIIIEAKNGDIVLDEVDKSKTITLTIGYRQNFKATLVPHKTYIDFSLIYMGGVTDEQRMKLRPQVLPKDKLKAKMQDALREEAKKDRKERAVAKAVRQRTREKERNALYKEKAEELGISVKAYRELLLKERRALEAKKRKLRLEEEAYAKKAHINTTRSKAMSEARAATIAKSKSE